MSAERERESRTDETAEARRERLLATVARLPTGPGVYLFRAEGGAVAYVGKARNLQQRVKSYFQRGRDETRRASLFVDRYVHTIEFVSTATEPEAFLLENRLVKRHKPAYNVKLRDDKDFLYVRIDRRHAFPALGLARRPRGATRGVTHIGPFASASNLRHTLRTLGGIIPLRDCSDREFASRTRPCLKYDMGRCLAPCVGWIVAEEYGRLLDQATGALEGRVDPVLEDLERRMQQASGDERYEQAARMRDQIRALRAVTGSQQVENTGVAEADAVGLHRAGGLAQVVVLFVRRGALVSTASHAFESELPDEELLADFLREYYGEGRPVARELLLPFELPDAEGLAAFLGERHKQEVTLVAEPARGARRALVELAAKNARHALAVTVEQRGHQLALLEALAARLGLARPPETLECYDVSNTGRTGIVASRVAFRHGEPDRDRYRHYRIRTLADQDDYGALAEVLRRRLARRDTDPLPDLLIVDGGKGQLGVAVRAVEEAGLTEAERPALAALAKGGRRGRSLLLDAGEQERVFLPGRDEPVVLDRNTPEEYLLQRLRDEAHRFAIGHHRLVRGKESLASGLDDIPGIGPVLKRRLLSAFGGSRGLARASVEEIAAVRGVGPGLAQAIADRVSNSPG